MTSRNAKGQFTSGDEYPQWLNMTEVDEAAAGTAVTAQTQLPVRINERQVLEILGVEWQFLGTSVGNLDADKYNLIHAVISKKALPDPLVENGSINNPDVIDSAMIVESIQWAESTETGGAGFATPKVIWHDFAASGKGFLVASQALHLGLESGAGNAVAKVRARILYRLVTVSAAELIGLVSQ